MFLEKFRVDGKIAIITGGTRGIGLSIAHALGEAGAKLVLTNRTDKFGGLESLKKENYDVSFFEADLLDKSIPQKVIDHTLEKQLETEAHLQGEAGRTSDFKEGVMAFLEKRKPQFEGR